MSKTDKVTEGSPVSLGFKVRELLTGLRSGARKSAGPEVFFIIKVYFLRIDPRTTEGVRKVVMKVSTTTSNSPKEDAMKEVTNTGKIYAGSGSRSLKLDPEMFTRVFNRLIEMIRQTKPSLIISGMAEGFDEALALAAMATQTPLKAMIPFKGYCNHYWGKKSLTGKNRLNECKQIVAYAQKTGGVEYICSDWRGADGRWAMTHRNEAMANACHKAWVYNPTTAGTKQFHDYCENKRIPMYIIKFNNGEGPGDIDRKSVV